MATKKTDIGGGAQPAGEGNGMSAGAASTPPAGGAKTAGARKGASAASQLTGVDGGTGNAAGGSAAGKGAAAKGAAGGKTAAGAKSAAGAKGASAAKTATRGAKAGGQNDLRSDARSFAAGRPDGWSHEDWLSFLEELRDRGHNIEDREAIGSMLERERLSLALEKVQGIGPQRVRSIAEKYGNVWRLKETSADDLARDASIPRPLAERIIESMR